MRPLSVSTVAFDGYGLDRAIAGIAEAGAALVELAFIQGYVDFDEDSFADAKGRALRQRIVAAGLGARCVSAHMDLSNPDAKAMLARRIGFAAMIGAEILITNAGPATGRDAITRVLEEAAGTCEQAGVTIALENPGHGWGALIEDSASGARFIHELDCPWIGLNYDAGNVHTYSRGALQPADDGAGADGWVSAHLKDMHVDGDALAFVPVGEGDVDYPRFWPRLPPSLPVSLELPFRLFRHAWGDPARRDEPAELAAVRSGVARSIDFVRRLDGEPA